MFENMSEDEIRSICKNNLEALEKWARTVVHMIMTEKLGNNYFFSKDTRGESYVKKEIVDKAQKMMREMPTRFSRPIDTLFLDEIIYLLCKKSLFDDFFKIFLLSMYPLGSEEVRVFLSRLVPIRNKLSHSNPVSVREVEQCVCYCQDFIDAVKLFFTSRGVDNLFNVPNAIRLNDSLGNEFSLNKDRSFQLIEIKDVVTNKLKQFFIGDNYSAWLTLDPSFPRESYTFDWHIETGPKLSATDKLDITISNIFIQERLSIYCTIRSTNSWHRYRGYDQQFAIVFQVPPPIQ